MLRPAYLQAGDKIALVSPAGFIHRQHLENACHILQSWGLTPVVGKHAAAQFDSFAGTNAERREDLQWALDDQEIKAIFCTTGGYGSLRIIENLDYSVFQGTPKWLVGSREITAFHSQLNLLGVESIYAPMPSDYPILPPAALENLRRLLFGENLEYSIENNPLSCQGIVQAEISGGCISMTRRLHATTLQHNFKGNILFLDLTTAMLEMESLLTCMKFSKIFQHIQGLVITDTLPQLSDEAVRLINEISANYNYPVCVGWPVSNNPLILGAKIILTINETKTKIYYV